jgi:hypothetical protein
MDGINHSQMGGFHIFSQIFTTLSHFCHDLKPKKIAPQEEKLLVCTDQVAFAEAESTEVLDSAVAMLEGEVTQDAGRSVGRRDGGT